MDMDSKHTDQIAASMLDEFKALIRELIMFVQQ